MSEQGMGEQPIDNQVSATIIPFPIKQRPVMAASPAPAELGTATERLATALSSLSIALAEQRDATLRWRNALSDLSDRVQTMNVSAQRAAKSVLR